MPFPAKEKDELFEKIKKGQVDFIIHKEFGKVSNEAVDLIKSMLSLDAKKRPTAVQILENPWISKNHLENEGLGEEIIQKLKNFKSQPLFKRTVMNIFVKMASQGE